MAMHSRSNKEDAPDRAEAVLARFSELSSEGILSVHPDEYTYALLLKTWYGRSVAFNSAHLNTQPFLLSSGRTQSRRSDGIEKAADRLEWMRSLYHAGHECAVPDVVKVCESRACGGTSRNSMLVSLSVCNYSIPPLWLPMLERETQKMQLRF
jgi:hypothetical protein